MSGWSRESAPRMAAAGRGGEAFPSTSFPLIQRESRVPGDIWNRRYGYFIVMMAVAEWHALPQNARRGSIILGSGGKRTGYGDDNLDIYAQAFS